MQVTWPSGVGAVIALIVFIVALIFGLLGRLPWEVAALFMALALARLL